MALFSDAGQTHRDDNRYQTGIENDQAQARHAGASVPTTRALSTTGFISLAALSSAFVAPSFVLAASAREDKRSADRGRGHADFDDLFEDDDDGLDDIIRARRDPDADSDREGDPDSDPPFTELPGSRPALSPPIQISFTPTIPPPTLPLSTNSLPMSTTLLSTGTSAPASTPVSLPTFTNPTLAPTTGTGTASTPSTPTPTDGSPILVFATVDDTTTCRTDEISWVYTGNQNATVSLTVSNDQIPQQGLSNSNQVISQTIVGDASSVQAWESNFVWQPVTVPQGRYVVLGTVAGAGFSSNIFTVTNGSDTSCVRVANPSTTPGSPTQTNLPNPSNGSGATSHVSGGAIAGGVLGGLFFAGAMIAALYLWRMCRRVSRRRSALERSRSRRNLYGSGGSGAYGGAYAFGKDGGNTIGSNGLSRVGSGGGGGAGNGYGAFGGEYAGYGFGGYREKMARRESKESRDMLGATPTTGNRRSAYNDHGSSAFTQTQQSRDSYGSFMLGRNSSAQALDNFTIPPLPRRELDRESQHSQLHGLQNVDDRDRDPFSTPTTGRSILGVEAASFDDDKLPASSSSSPTEGVVPLVYYVPHPEIEPPTPSHQAEGRRGSAISAGAASLAVAPTPTSAELFYRSNDGTGRPVRRASDPFSSKHESRISSPLTQEDTTVGRHSYDEDTAGTTATSSPSPHTPRGITLSTPSPPSGGQRRSPLTRKPVPAYDVPHTPQTASIISSNSQLQLSTDRLSRSSTPLSSPSQTDLPGAQDQEQHRRGQSTPSPIPPSMSFPELNHKSSFGDVKPMTHLLMPDLPLDMQGQQR